MEPHRYDWYETVKLNYGFITSWPDCRPSACRTGRAPSGVPRPGIMDDILSFWQGLGIGGFRCDMARDSHGLPLVYASAAVPCWCDGQEVGERAESPGGYGGHDGRTSIFDYTCLPQLQPWVALRPLGVRHAPA